MRRFVLLLLWSLFVMNVSSAQDTPRVYRVIAYYPSWTSASYPIENIPADQITHINYAFAAIDADGEIVISDSSEADFEALTALKAEHSHLRTLISVGGWTESDFFSDAALTPESRARFADSAAEFIEQHGFDGVDLDWEYPTGGGEPGNVERPEDPANFVLLLTALRERLDRVALPTDERPLITIAAGASPAAIEGLDWPAIAAQLDWVNAMTYDFRGGWSETTGHHAPLYASEGNPLSVDEALQTFLAAGVPADQLTMGVPFYARSWSGLPPTNNGMGQPFTSAGEVRYAELIAGERFWDADAQAPWWVTDDGKTLTFFTGDDTESMTLKAQYVRDQGLGGVMIWELTQDTDAHTLLNAVTDTLNAP